MTRLIVRSIALSALLVATAAPAWDVSGDFRTHLYTEAWRDTRDGATESSAESGARFRLRLREAINERCRFQTRFAATVVDEGNDFDFYIRANRDSGTEVNPGTATLDEFFVACESGASEWRVGRMQSNLDSIHMATRSFDRSQASAINIGWTDAIAYRRNFDNGWYGEALLQYNGRDGNGQTFRGPITFDDSDARIGFFGVLGSDEAAGPILMRALSLTVYPDALAPAGTASAERDDYVMAAFKIGAGWDVDDAGRRLIAIGEIAHAPNTPLKSALGLPGQGDVDGWGWQVGTDLENILPNNSVGINYGQSDGGMLISNDFRQNNELFEFRWQYQVTSALRFEFRYRWRRELERRIGAEFLQRDRDVRLRATYKF
ncbi:hypothetical protein HFP89_04510 [Wenzhouxiangella sp. XN79A]|uniref:hypothetical protein n=1 Tax=Wenzhouxiangella sp. XN79A TaxID=2724193 RepID=UPI00144A8EB9|nr:hypothetical protein [Wenzhouxiangella sp. XN79A]NKI34423.1 hypothetical protein [Wenzhouxiangella sp. XN79A]